VTKRLQVLLEEDELAEIKRAARRRRQSVAEWVRTALREARSTEAGRPASAKLRALRASSAHAFPTGSIEEMLDEIDRGYRETP
jgi:hypothetical protein